LRLIWRGLADIFIECLDRTGGEAHGIVVDVRTSLDDSKDYDAKGDREQTPETESHFLPTPWTQSGMSHHLLKISGGSVTSFSAIRTALNQRLQSRAAF